MPIARGSGHVGASRPEEEVRPSPNRLRDEEPATQMPNGAGQMTRRSERAMLLTEEMPTFLDRLL